MGLSTSYFTVDGEIIGESTNGTRLDYLTDALGSVTAKVDQAGAVGTTARYKPYGDQLSGSAYAFGWVGSYGYRKAVNGSYVRARHYSKVSGNWTFVDGMWPDNTQPYSYVIARPVNLIDPSGWVPRISRIPGVPPEKNACGNTFVAWTFLVVPAIEANGWIIQYVEFEPWDVKTCDGQIVNPPCHPYFEAWLVINGVVMKRQFGRYVKGNSTHDRWGVPASGIGLYGCGFDATSESWKGETKFVPYDYVSDEECDKWLVKNFFNINGNACSGQVPAAPQFPWWFTPIKGDTADFTMNWACCRTKTCISPEKMCNCPPSNSDACRRTTLDYHPKQ